VGNACQLRRSTLHVLLAVLITVACTGKGETSVTEPPTPGAAPSPTASIDPTVPRARAYAQMADFSGEPGVLLFGGQYGTPPGTGLSDVWAYRPEDGWGQLDPGEEDVRGGEGFVLDADSNVLVTVDEPKTRTFDPRTGDWRTLRTTDHPSNTWGTRFTYDSGSDQVISFGGFDGSALYDETWALDVETQTWTRMHPRERPPAENYHAMEYDPGTDRVILFNLEGETWAYDYDTDTWRNMSPRSAPEARTYTGMAFDPVGERIILFGGVTEFAEDPFGDTWAYDPLANRWTDLDPITAPSPRGWHSMATDAETGAIYLFSGGATRDTDLADLWRFDPRRDEWFQVA